MKERDQIAGMLRLVSTMTPRQLVDRMNKFSAAVSREDLQFKQASLGGEQDGGFEQSFASLAYTYIADKAPGLLDYLIGFQLVDRDEKDTKAVGVFGFKVGSQWMYVPVFFLSGDIKGHELLFLKQLQQFVPLKENWINYLINRKPQQLGEGVPQNSAQLGVLQPNLSNAIRSPGGFKFAHVVERPWSKHNRTVESLVKMSGDLEALRHLTAYLGDDRQVPSLLDLRPLLAKSAEATAILAQTCEAWPGVKVALDKHYGPDLLPTMLRKHIKRAEEEEEQAKPVLLRKRIPVNQHKKRSLGSVLKGAAADNPPAMAVSKVEVITENLPTLTDEERQKLLRDGKLIKDHRSGQEKTVEYNTTTPMSLNNPTETGVYDILTGQGEFEKCLVIFAPYDGTKRRRYVTVVRLDGQRNWINVHPSHVFYRQSAEPDQREKDDWFKDLPGGSDSPAQNGVYVAVGVTGQGTVPFRAGADLGDGLHEANFLSDGSESADEVPRGPSFVGGCCPGDRDPTIQLNKRKGSSFLLQNGNTYIPENAKLIKIKDPPKCDKCGAIEMDCCCDFFRYPHYDNKLKPIILGDLKDLQLALRQKTAELKVVDDACELIINNRRFTKFAGLVHLVQEHGLDEQDARRLLKEAERFHGVRWRVKYANEYPMMGGFPPPTAGGDGGYMGPTNQYIDPYTSAPMPYGGMSPNMVEPLQVEETVPHLNSSLTDPNIYNPMLDMDPMAMQTAQQASQTGQKEVFDTAMFNSLTRAIRPDSMVDGDLGNISQTVNILGRMLFLFYWHNEEFQERYGKKDLPELSDTLRNAFEMLGDLLLYLKQKSVDTVFGTELRNTSPDIGDAAGN